MNKEVKTNLRWAGGKSKMLKILEEFFPKEIDKYIETFTGGGSVMLHILQNYSPNVVYANDIDDMLINYHVTRGKAEYQNQAHKCCKQSLFHVFVLLSGSTSSF